MSPAVEERIDAHKKCSHPHLRDGRERSIDLTFAARFQNMSWPPNRASRRLQFFCVRLGRWKVWVHEKSEESACWKQVVQQSESLSRKLNGENVHARGVAARPTKTGDEAYFDRIIASVEHDRDTSGGSHCHER